VSPASVAFAKWNPTASIELRRRQAKRLAKLLMDQLPYRLRRHNAKAIAFGLASYRGSSAGRAGFNLCQNKLIARAPTALSFLDTGRTVRRNAPHQRLTVPR